MKSNKIISKNLKTYFPAFTLVELIVVIVILAILATIAFLSFNSYSSWARDSKRMSNVALIARWFEVNISLWKAIVTSETAMVPNIILSWSVLQTSWPFSWGFIRYEWFYDSPVWQKLLKSIWIWWWDINSQTEDLEKYKFTYVPAAQKYQVSWRLENANSVAFYNKINSLQLDLSSLYDNTFADTSTWYIFIKWNYFGTWWIEGLLPIQSVWEATTPDANWARVIAWEDTIVAATWWVVEIPAPAWLPTCTFDATDDSGKFNYCAFGL